MLRKNATHLPAFRRGFAKMTNLVEISLESVNRSLSPRSKNAGYEGVHERKGMSFFLGGKDVRLYKAARDERSL